MKRSAATASSGEVLLSASALDKAVQALADGIRREFARDLDRLAVVGIQTRGAILARRLAGILSRESGRTIPLGILDITLYRDDVHAIADQPEVKETDLPFDLDDRPIVLVDDVLFTGRTVRSAMNALIDYGRPRCIRLASLVDRGHRELPIRADYVGLAVETHRDDIVDVNLRESDGDEGVRLRRRGGV